MLTILISSSSTNHPPGQKKRRLKDPVPVYQKKGANNDLLFLGNTDSLSSSAGSLGVLTSDGDSPVMSQTTMQTDLLHALQILTELIVQTVGKDLTVLSGLDILLTIKEPFRDLVLKGVLDNGDDALKFFIAEFTGSVSNKSWSVVALQ